MRVEQRRLYRRSAREEEGPGTGGLEAGEGRPKGQGAARRQLNYEAGWELAAGFMSTVEAVRTWILQHFQWRGGGLSAHPRMGGEKVEAGTRQNIDILLQRRAERWVSSWRGSGCPVCVCVNMTKVTTCFCGKEKDSIVVQKMDNVGEGRLSEAPCVGKR